MPSSAPTNGPNAQTKKPSIVIPSNFKLCDGCPSYMPENCSHACGVTDACRDATMMEKYRSKGMIHERIPDYFTHVPMTPKMQMTCTYNSDRLKAAVAETVRKV